MKQEIQRESVYPLFSLRQGVRLQSRSLRSVARPIPPHTPCSQGRDLIEVVGLPFPSCAPRGERTFICVTHVSSRHAVQKSNSTYLSIALNQKHCLAQCLPLALVEEYIPPAAELCVGAEELFISVNVAEE